MYAYPPQGPHARGPGPYAPARGREPWPWHFKTSSMLADPQLRLKWHDRNPTPVSLVEHEMHVNNAVAYCRVVSRVSSMAKGPIIYFNM